MGKSKVFYKCNKGCITASTLYTLILLLSEGQKAVSYTHLAVVEGDVVEAAKEMARKILSKGTYAVSYAKAAVNYGLETDITTATAYEASVFGLCFGNPEQREGMTAFLEKRKPNFKDAR